MRHPTSYQQNQTTSYVTGASNSLANYSMNRNITSTSDYQSSVGTTAGYVSVLSALILLLAVLYVVAMKQVHMYKIVVFIVLHPNDLY
jgi:hypothetical protein